MECTLHTVNLQNILTVSAVWKCQKLFIPSHVPWDLGGSHGTSICPTPSIVSCDYGGTIERSHWIPMAIVQIYEIWSLLCWKPLLCGWIARLARCVSHMPPKMGDFAPIPPVCCHKCMHPAMGGTDNIPWDPPIMGWDGQLLAKYVYGNRLSLTYLLLVYFFFICLYDVAIMYCKKWTLARLFDYTLQNTLVHYSQYRVLQEHNTKPNGFQNNNI